MTSKSRWQVGCILVGFVACVLGAMQVRVKALASGATSVEQENKLLKAENAKLKSELKAVHDKAAEAAASGHFEKCWYKGAKRDVWVSNKVPASTETTPKKSSTQVLEYNPPVYDNQGNCVGGSCSKSYSSRKGKRGKW